MPKFGLKEEHYRLIKKLFSAFLPEDTEVLVFGSRARGDHKTYSDLDIALKFKQPIDPKALDQIRENLAESSIPIQVELVIYDSLEPTFQKIIQKDQVVF